MSVHAAEPGKVVLSRQEKVVRRQDRSCGLRSRAQCGLLAAEQVHRATLLGQARASLAVVVVLDNDGDVLRALQHPAERERT